ncbi:MAG: AzlC family ABC transporter permease [Actinomycetota bacterium]|nr:AzlC family ABC transporter permease [Actinomycetota bacterium]
MTAIARQGETEPTAPRAEVLRGLRGALPLMLSLVPIGLLLGAQASQKGLSVVEVPLMTGLNFAGGSEFAAVGLWTSPPLVLLIVAITFLVNSRHLLMGAALTPYLKHLPKRKALPALFLMCDESWAVGLSDAKQRSAAGHQVGFSLPYYLAAAAGLYLTWIVSTAAGTVLAPGMGDVEAYGFDMAFVAVFLVLIRGMWKGARPARPWLVSLLAAASTFLLVPGAWYVAAGAAAGLLSAALWAEEA